MHTHPYASPHILVCLHILADMCAHLYTTDLIFFKKKFILSFKAILEISMIFRKKGGLAKLCFVEIHTLKS